MVPAFRKRNKVDRPSRKSNWDSHETLLLLNAYENERTHLIEDGYRSKQAFWRRITDSLYSDDSPFQRTHLEVQKKWRNLCTAVRHEIKKNELKKKNGVKLKPLPHILAKVARLIIVEDKMKKQSREKGADQIAHVKEKENESSSKAIPNANRKSTVPSNLSGFVNSMPRINPVLIPEPIVPSTSNSANNPDVILPTPLPSSIPVILKEQTTMPVIKTEPLSPTPDTEPVKTVTVTAVSEAKSVSAINSSSQQIFTFSAPALTNTTTSGPSPLKIISIVNPLSPTGSHNCSRKPPPPKIIFKPITAFPNLSKPSTSNMVLFGPAKLPRLKKLSHGVLGPSPQVQKLEEKTRNVDVTALKVEAEKLAWEQERIKIEKEKLEIEKEKLNIEKEKLRYAQLQFQNEKASKRSRLEERKVFLENKKLKSEIGKLDLERELLAVQLTQMKN